MTKVWHPRPGETVEELARRVIGEAQALRETQVRNRLRRIGRSAAEIEDLMAELRATHEQLAQDALDEMYAQGLDTAPTVITH